MVGGRGWEASPVPTYIHDLLRLAISPRGVVNHALSGCGSGHSAIQRGALRPTFTRSPGTTAVSISGTPGAWPMVGFEVWGTFDGRTHGKLFGDGERWRFASDSGRHVSTKRPGAFVADALSLDVSTRHLLWVGKNSLPDVELVVSQTDAMARCAASGSSLVMGQWVTTRDRDNAPVRDAVRRLNDRLRWTYGDGFIDVQALLTSARGLRSHVVLALDLMGRWDVQRDVADGIVPAALQGSDGAHLNGWGNLVVGSHVIERMRDRGWV